MHHGAVILMRVLGVLLLVGIILAVRLGGTPYEAGRSRRSTSKTERTGKLVLAQAASLRYLRGLPSCSSVAFGWTLASATSGRSSHPSGLVDTHHARHRTAVHRGEPLTDTAWSPR